MGKRIHGRLVHEVRDMLCRAGYMPTRDTQLGDLGSLRPTRSPGFKVEKHNDGKSVRLTYVTAAGMTSATKRHPGSSPACSPAAMIASYNAALEREGFIPIMVNDCDHMPPYTLWRRADESRHANHSLTTQSRM